MSLAKSLSFLFFFLNGTCNVTFIEHIPYFRSILSSLASTSYMPIFQPTKTSCLINFCRVLFIREEQSQLLQPCCPLLIRLLPLLLWTYLLWPPFAIPNMLYVHQTIWVSILISSLTPLLFHILTKKQFFMTVGNKL